MPKKEKKKVNLIKLKRFLHSKRYNNNKKKNKLWTRRKYFQIMYLIITISKIYKEFIEANKKRSDCKMGNITE